MADDGTIPCESVMLISHWPDGVVHTCGAQLPFSSFTNATDHNVAAATQKMGSMIRYWNAGTVTDGVEGWATFMYGQNKTTAIAAALEICQPADAAVPQSVSSTVANALIADDISGLCAVSISAMTAAYYGWFWVDGVAPSDAVAALDGDLPTAGTPVVIVGQACVGAGDTPAKGVLRAQAAGELDMACAWCLAAA